MRKKSGLFITRNITENRGISHEDAVRQAICFGWIDGVIKRLDGERTVRRFSPRKPESRWSAINIKRAEELIRNGEMTPAGLAAYKPERKIKAQPRTFSSELNKLFSKNKAAWNNFKTFPPYYRRMTAGWVESASKPETRLKRLHQLIDFSAANKKIDFMASARKTKGLVAPWFIHQRQ